MNINVTKLLSLSLLAILTLSASARSASTYYEFPDEFVTNPTNSWALYFGTDVSSMTYMTPAGSSCWNCIGIRPSYGENSINQFYFTDRYAYKSAFLVFNCPQTGKYSLNFDIYHEMQTWMTAGIHTEMEVYTSLSTSPIWSKVYTWNSVGSANVDMGAVGKVQQMVLSAGDRIILRFDIDNVGGNNQCLMDIQASSSDAASVAGIQFDDIESVSNPLPDDEFVTVNNEHFYHNGERIRFWGVNFVNLVKQTWGDIPLLLDRIVDGGFNAIRLNLFDGTFLEGQTQDTYHVATTVPGSDSALDRLDFAIYLARQKGLFFYFTFDKRTVWAGDYDILPDDGHRTEWVNMACNSGIAYKYLVYLDDRAEASHIAYCKAIMNHLNPYTGNTYADEEAIAMVELFNENCFLTAFTPQNEDQGVIWNALPSYVQEKIRVKWNTWLLNKYGTHTAMNDAWKYLGIFSNLNSGENLASGNIQFNNGPYGAGQRVYDIVEFNTWLFNDYNTRLIAELRTLNTTGRGINVIPITPTTVYSSTLVRYYAAQLAGDFTATSNYGVAGYKYATPEPFYCRLQAAPMFENPMDVLRIKGKPFVIYETNDYRPNPYGVEYPIRVASIMAYQDADAVFWFCWDDQNYHPDLHMDTDYTTSRLPMPDIGFPNSGLFLANDEVIISALKSAGAIFRNASIPAATSPYEWTIGKDDIFNLSSSWSTEYTYLRRKAWLQGVRVVFNPNVNSTSVSATSSGTTAQQGPYVLFDWASSNPGTMKIDAPTTKAMVGFFGPNVTIGDTTISDINQSFSSVVITSQDGLDLSDSEEVLITMAATSHNTGYIFEPDNMLGNHTDPYELARAMQSPGNKGIAPVIYERVAGSISAAWMAGMRYEKYRFDRGCYEEGEIDSSNPVLTMLADEPLFYARLFYEETLLPGDANGDGAVDVGDLGILAANYGTASGADWSQGDFNGDGAVDVGDLGILAANYGSGSSSNADFDADYAKVFDARVEESNDETDMVCQSLGLPLIAGLLLVGFSLVSVTKLKD